MTPITSTTQSPFIVNSDALSSFDFSHVPADNVIYLCKEDYDALVERINNPGPPNERLVKLMTEPSALERFEGIAGEPLDPKTAEAFRVFAKKQTDTPTYRHDSDADSGQSS